MTLTEALAELADADVKVAAAREALRNAETERDIAAGIVHRLRVEADRALDPAVMVHYGGRRVDVVVSRRTKTLIYVREPGGTREMAFRHDKWAGWIQYPKTDSYYYNTKLEIP